MPTQAHVLNMSEQRRQVHAYAHAYTQRKSHFQLLDNLYRYSTANFWAFMKLDKVEKMSNRVPFIDTSLYN